MKPGRSAFVLSPVPPVHSRPANKRPQCDTARDEHGSLSSFSPTSSPSTSQSSSPSSSLPSSAASSSSALPNFVLYPPARDERDSDHLETPVRSKVPTSTHNHFTYPSPGSHTDIKTRGSQATHPTQTHAHSQPVKVAYEVHGMGPVKVLFVPGMCVSRSMWEAQVKEFAKHPNVYSLCLIDNRGSGDSDIPPAALFDSRNVNYSIDTLATDAWAVVDRVFGKSCKVHIVGHSMGSMISQRIALKRLDRIASLALMSGNAGGWVWTNVPPIELVRAAFDLFRTGFDEHVSADVSMRLHFTPGFLNEHVVDEKTGEKRLRRDQYRKRYLDGIRRDKVRDQDGCVFWGHLAAVRSHNLSHQEAEALRNAPFEILVVYGKDDGVVPPVASRDLARRIGAQEVCVPGAHFIVDESAHEVNASLLELWKTCPVREEPRNFVLESYIVRSLIRCNFFPA